MVISIICTAVGTLSLCFSYIPNLNYLITIFFSTLHTDLLFVCGYEARQYGYQYFMKMKIIKVHTNGISIEHSVYTMASAVFIEHAYKRNKQFSKLK